MPVENWISKRILDTRGVFLHSSLFNFMIKEQEIKKRQQLFDTMIINPGIQIRVNGIVAKMKANQARYETVSHQFSNPGLTWQLVALLHQMEAELNFSKYLGNGQDLSKITTKVPKGRGPFATFEEGAIDAIQLQGLDEITDWSMGNLLFILEGYNGYGYSIYNHGNTPYLWAGSNQYIKGKYVELKGADGQYHVHYDPELVSSQIGIALLLKSLLAA